MDAQRNNKKGKKGFKRLSNAFSYSISGIISAWRDEEAFRQIALLALLLIPTSFLALCVELINSAIENAIDFTSLEIHPLAKKAKDMGSATQLFALILWIIVWGGYCIDRFIL